MLVVFVGVAWAIYTPSGRRAKPCSEVREALEKRYDALMSQHVPANTVWVLAYFWGRWAFYRLRCVYYRGAVTLWNESMDPGNWI